MQYSSLYELTSSVRAGTGNSRDKQNHKDAHASTAASRRFSHKHFLFGLGFFILLYAFNWTATFSVVQRTGFTQFCLFFSAHSEAQY